MDVTAHVMVRNEENYIEPVMDSIIQAGFREVLVVDCASQDRTFEKLVPYGRLDRVRLTRTAILTPEENGQVRQWLTDRTRTRWAMIIDGDEYYWPYVLRRLLKLEIPEGKKFGYTTLANVQLDDEGYYVASQFSKHAFFDADKTVWEGPYPFENPEDILLGNEDGRLNHYFGEDLLHRLNSWHGLHLRLLQRSPYDEETHLRVTLRETVHRRPEVLRRLRYLPVPARSSYVSIEAKLVIA